MTKKNNGPESDNENQPLPSVTKKRKSTVKDKGNDAVPKKPKKKREEASVILRYQAPSLPVSTTENFTDDFHLTLFKIVQFVVCHRIQIFEQQNNEVNCIQQSL